MGWSDEKSIYMIQEVYEKQQLQPKSFPDMYLPTITTDTSSRYMSLYEKQYTHLSSDRSRFTVIKYVLFDRKGAPLYTKEIERAPFTTQGFLGRFTYDSANRYFTSLLLPDITYIVPLDRIPLIRNIITNVSAKQEAEYGAYNSYNFTEVYTIDTNFANMSEDYGIDFDSICMQREFLKKYIFI